jgi:ribose transport system permease protein
MRWHRDAVKPTNLKSLLPGLSSDYGMLGVLLLLCLYFSWATLQEQYPEGEAAAEIVARKISKSLAQQSNVLVIARTTAQDLAFAGSAQFRLRSAGFNIVEVVKGDPAVVRRSFEALADSGENRRDRRDQRVLVCDQQYQI